MYAQLGAPPRFAGYISIAICGGTVVSSALSAKLTGRFGTGIVTVAGVKRALAAFFCYSAIEAAAGLWGSPHPALARRTPPEIAARRTPLYYTEITAGRFASGFSATGLGSRRVIRVGRGVAALGAALLPPPLERMGMEGRLVILPAFFIICCVRRRKISAGAVRRRQSACKWRPPV
jgi:hypothetical protein